MAVNTPVLLITFNRPDYVEIMIDALRKCEVRNLYIFKDGPRPGNEADREAAKKINEVIKSIDWQCSVNKLLLNNNLGCGYGPYTAISWAFGQEDQLIILEDDCIPTQAFFKFCEEMLEKYKDNRRVRHISGRSHMSRHKAFAKSDYLFTQYAPTWGWATWRRTWDDFDMQMRGIPSNFNIKSFASNFSDRKEAAFFFRRFLDLKKSRSAVFHIWDYQYGVFTRTRNDLCIIPAKNLIKYIGAEGTHPAQEGSSVLTMDVSAEFKVDRHPATVELDKEYEAEYFTTFVSKPKTAVQILKEKIKRIIGREMV